MGRIIISTTPCDLVQSGTGKGAAGLPNRDNYKFRSGLTRNEGSKLQKTQIPLKI